MTDDFHALFAPSIITLLDALDQLIGPVYLAGGTVRNMLQNRPLANELNLLVQRPLSECHHRLVQGGFPMVTVGTKRHEVWTSGHSSLFLPLAQEGGLKQGGESTLFARTSHISHLEITSFRHRMEYPPTLEEDLLHRDLTVNAMAFAWPHGPLVDPFNGQEDLANRRIRFVKGSSTLEDDPLRALRFFRFLLQLEAVPDEADLQAAEETSMEMIPKKKLRAELDRMFSLPFNGPDRYPNVERFFYSPLAQEIFADMATPPICKTGETPAHRCRRAIELMRVMTEPEIGEEVPLHDLRWTALFYAMGELNCIGQEKGQTRSTLHGVTLQRIQEILKKFRFSQRRQHNIFQMLHHLDVPLTPTDRTLLRMMGNNDIPIPALFRLIHARSVVNARELREKADDASRQTDSDALFETQLHKTLGRYRMLQKASLRPTPHDLAITGGEIIDLVRQPPGAWVGELVALLLEWISHDSSRNNRAQLHEKIREWVTKQVLV
ncbi:MAG: CCA tRNA nucleotidyltransferase [Magnetococcales bacterium]|nr:CCA tRNA nucleotidyltransferase [Magnetococcales bacterium]